MIKENLLIVCFDIKDFKKIDKINFANYDKVIVASDDYRVHEECEKLDIINDTTFIQRAIPYTKVAEDVINIIQKINFINKELSAKTKIFDYKTLEWVYHVEGGQNTQKIQDLLLYLESIDEIISEFSINQILVISNLKHSFIMNIMSLYAKDNNIKLNKTKQNGVLKAFDMKEIVRPYYYLAKTISIKIKHKKTIDKTKQNIAVFWLFDSATKHLNNSKFINNVLKKSGFNPLAFSWRVGNFAKSDINLQRIESYISWNEIFISIMKTVLLIINKDNIKKEIDKQNFYYKNIQIDDILLPVILKYILVESPDSYRFSCGFKQFSNDLDIQMISGNLNSQRLGNIVESILPIYSINKFAMSTFLTGKNIYYEYRMQKYPKIYWDNLYYFVQNKIEKDRVTKEINIDNSQVVVYGSNRASNKNDFSKDLILKKFNISNECKYIILIDYSNFLFGYQSISEISKVLITILNKFETNEDVCLLIKPHPSARMTLFYSLQKKYKSDKVIFLNKKDNIDELLFISDILISKYSTVGIEAIKYSTLVISPQLCKSDYFRLYGEFAFYKHSIKELNDFLEELIYSKDNFEKYKKCFIQKSQEFINDFYIPLDENIVIEILKGQK